MPPNTIASLRKLYQWARLVKRTMLGQKENGKRTLANVYVLKGGIAEGTGGKRGERNKIRHSKRKESDRTRLKKFQYATHRCSSFCGVGRLCNVSPVRKLSPTGAAVDLGRPWNGGLALIGWTARMITSIKNPLISRAMVRGPEVPPRQRMHGEVAGGCISLLATPSGHLTSI
ncbi:hypothetical protein WN48_09688 [Eufriesea mexicana]|uniref:Uncharacterized protein n=1 Tax=Eufriesea mexicana TaxID=516756 RepID=A0A310SE71_9HYME|nr:hypothetical protein WN48_09688 [Eufriesea mexicana]